VSGLIDIVIPASVDVAKYIALHRWGNIHHVFAKVVLMLPGMAVGVERRTHVL
jgi:hypothetical protein